MIVTNEFNMDLALPGAPPVVHAVQGDKCTRQLKIGLFSNGATWLYPEGAGAIVHYQKPDGTGGSYDTMPDGTAAAQLSADAGTGRTYLTVQLAPQVLTCAGAVLLAVSLINGETQISTFRVKICVQARPGAALTSEDYYNVTSFVAASGWGANMYLGTDENGNVVAKDAPAAVEVAVEDVLEAMPVVSTIDFSNWSSGSFTETVDGEEVTHTVTETDNGVTIDGLTVIFPAEEST